VAQAVDPEIRSSDFGLDLVIPENTTVRVVYRAADGTESTPQPLVTRTQLNAALSAQQAQMQTLLVCIYLILSCWRCARARIARWQIKKCCVSVTTISSAHNFFSSFLRTHSPPTPRPDLPH
jgi:hypothetical protein